MTYTNTYLYTGKTIADIDDLSQSLKGNDIPAYYTYSHSGELAIETDHAKSAVDAAVQESLAGSLFSNKHEKMRQVKSKSNQLVEKGVDSWSTGQKVKCTKRQADDYFTDYKYFSEHPDKLTVSKPYVITDVEDKVVSTSTASDIEAIADASTDRLQYLYTSVLNGDGSSGEVKLIELIHDASDQTALDLIMDTRE